MGGVVGERVLVQSLRISAMATNAHKLTREEILSMSLSERLELMSEIWSTIVDSPASVPLTDEERQYLDECIEEYRRNPDAGEPWEKVLGEIRSRR
jgi:putative addiction module component (TIGR02574 family)